VRFVPREMNWLLASDKRRADTHTNRWLQGQTSNLIPSSRSILSDD
jgi:hypothetical protein